ncbi:hypothetical protein RRF57_000089 [Xylaria bambusicola]|uniref:Uncharacterized protein n=1 Tax=Xylaria bambusicola TaxID=326684 RepID=A0AAN7U9L8_9PEZI
MFPTTQGSKETNAESNSLEKICVHAKPGSAILVNPARYDIVLLRSGDNRFSIHARQRESLSRFGNRQW